jgi:hypothetical protein
VLYVRPDRITAAIWIVAYPLFAAVFSLTQGGDDRSLLASMGFSVVPSAMGIHQMWFSYLRLDDTVLERVRFFGLQHDRAQVSAITRVGMDREPTAMGDKLRMVIEWPDGRLPLPLDQFLLTRRFPSMGNVELIPLVVELKRRGVSIDAELDVELGLPHP